MHHRFLVAPIWPTRQVHTLTGGSGVGKSTLLAAWLNALCDGEEILGFKPAFKTRPLYISSERHEEQLEIASAGVPEEKIEGWNMRCEVLSLRQAAKGTVYKKPDGKLLHSIVKKYHKDFRVICFDPILTFCDKPNDQNTVRNFLVDEVVADTLVPYDVTIIATGHPAKEREGQRVIGARTKNAGSYAWGAYTSCGHYAELIEPDNPDCKIIKLDVTPRLIAPFSIHIERVSFGRIKIIDRPDEAGKDFILSTFLNRPQIQTADIITFAKKSKISDRTVYRWLKKQKDSGVLDEAGNGLYNVVNHQAETVQ